MTTSYFRLTNLYLNEEKTMKQFKVFVISKFKIRFLINNVEYLNSFLKILKGFEFPSPMLIQAYGWPGILKLNHVVGISPVQTGKTFTYLCPLLSELLNPQSYQELAIGNGVCKDRLTR